MKQITGRLAAVTGAASGIGLATALALAAEGAKFALADVDMHGLEETSNMLEQQGCEVVFSRVDVTSAENMQDWAESIERDVGPVDIAINNAGIALLVEAHDQQHEDIARVMDINFWGVLHGTRAFLPGMRERNCGHIVNIASMAALTGLPTQSAYCASKFAVRGYSESIRAELNGTNVGITTVMQGGVKTEVMNRAEIRLAGQSSEQAENMRQMVNSFLRTPPEKAAKLIVRAIKRNRSRQLIGPDARMVDIFQRLIPASFPSLAGAGRGRLRQG
jgi:short-subunit dehydrogenase